MTARLRAVLLLLVVIAMLVFAVGSAGAGGGWNDGQKCPIQMPCSSA